MNITFDGGTSQQQTWFNDVLADSLYPFDLIEHDITVSWSADPNPGTEYEEAWTENQSATTSTIEILTTVDTAQGEAAYKTLVHHELAHVLMAHWIEAHQTLAQEVFGSTVWEPPGAGLNSWKASVKEACAECFKDCYWPDRSYDNLTNLKLRESKLDAFLSLWCPGSGGGGVSEAWVGGKGNAGGPGIVGGGEDYVALVTSLRFQGDDGNGVPYDGDTELVLTFTANDPDEAPDPARVAEWMGKSGILIEFRVQGDNGNGATLVERMWPDEIDSTDGASLTLPLGSGLQGQWIVVEVWSGGFGDPDLGWPVTSWATGTDIFADHSGALLYPTFHLRSTGSTLGGAEWPAPDGTPCHPAPWPYEEHGITAQSRPPTGVRRRNRRVAAARGKVEATEIAE